MSESYTRVQLKLAVAKILSTLGWNSANGHPLDILTGVLYDYLKKTAKLTANYATEFGCTTPTIKHVELAFNDLEVNIHELQEYVKYVNFLPPSNPVPVYPVPKEDHLNFLKPGSKEVVTRPVHIHEHLPPMNPLMEANENEAENGVAKADEGEEGGGEAGQLFKKPSDVLTPEFKRPSFRKEEEGSRPTREISSVMMTTSGFLSPAREGKLPESRTPAASLDPIGPPPPPAPEILDLNKKPVKPVKKVEKKRPKTGEPPAGTPPEEKKRKVTPMRCLLKAKQTKVPGGAPVPPSTTPSVENKPPVSPKTVQANKLNKALAAARLKTEKLNTTITPIPMRPFTPPSIPPPQSETENIDKLFTEPDKKKVNILKKISNVKNEKADIKPPRKEDLLRQESRESSPDLIIDEPDDISRLNLPSDITIEPINPVVVVKSPEKLETSYFDEDSQPGTPSTPKTPEMISHSPPLVKEKRKRKEGKRTKKVQKHQSPHRVDSDPIDIEMERPKTPEPQGLPPMGPSSIPFPFIAMRGPGLIPNPLNNPLFPPLAFPPMSLPPFVPRPPFMTSINQPIPMGIPTPPIPSTSISNPILQPPKMDEVLKPPVEKPTSSTNLVDATSPLPVASAKLEKKSREHKKERKDKLKKRNKKDKIKSKAEKKKLKEEKKEKIKKEKKEKKKEKESREMDSNYRNVKITLKLAPSPRPETPETKKLNIKPIIKKDEEPPNTSEERKREASPGLAKISALVCGPPKPKTTPPVVVPASEDAVPDVPITSTTRTGPGPGRPRIHPIKTKPIKPKKRRPAVKKDADGNEVWICPACGRQDDGSPMIGCDGCDAWYHWVCVGIQVPPDDNEDWYCRHCLSRKNEDLQTDKKQKKRKKREKKEH